MAALNCCSVIIVGAGISGIMAGKVLAETGVKDIVILEATDQIGGRMARTKFGGLTVDVGAGWIQGVGNGNGGQVNPIWDLANKYNLRTCYSDYSNARFNIYDQSGNVVPRSVAGASYDLAVNAANRELDMEASGEEDVEPQFVPSTPLELAIDYILNDFEMAEVEPIPTYTEFGTREFMVADERGYDYIVQKLAQQFLQSQNGQIIDDRLKLCQVVKEVEYKKEGVTITTEGGSIFNAKYCIVSASLGVLQSDLIKFKPELPRWKRNLFFDCDIRTYTKIFLKFPQKFWPTGDGTEFFLFAHEKRGYYTFWQHLENAYPGSNILMVTVTDEESKRIEAQSDEITMAEAMSVLKIMFGNNIPQAQEILVPRWWNNPFQRGSYTNYPHFVNKKHFQQIKAPVGPIYFTGEHTSEKFNGYVHGAYLSGIDTANMIVDNMKMKHENERYNSYSCGYASKKDERLFAIPSTFSSRTQLNRNWDIVRQMVWNRINVSRHNLGKWALLFSPLKYRTCNEVNSHS
ncbi:hypothetical protein SUGI_0232960 [Cryptomeria japonica]|uniref:polyamine oxidase 1 n=1 Tax=Cryptomeria japonica TaxID=3369 RepID=UPI002408A33F|nr:polyamine oxidase 1 [Cryptomeria japonica]GLJ14416.1 hypothetical protein SUGI_0232960 [Cryptomeria japonica]